MSMHGARRYIADLLRGRRPRAFPADSTDAADVRVAIMLRGSQPGADVPADTFVETLHERLKAELSEEDSPDRRSSRRTRRRQVMRIASVAATSAAIGAAADRVLTSDKSRETVGAQPEQQLLNPNTGSWRTVATSAELPEGGVTPFDLGTVTGFVQRTNGAAVAVSGVCTHLGCRLTLDALNRRLNCPCHRTAFAVNGQVLYHQLPIDLPPLPHIPVREEGGAVQVFVPVAGT